MPMRGYLPVKTLTPDDVGQGERSFAWLPGSDDATLVFWASILGLAITFYLMVEFPDVGAALTLFAQVP
jgi:hypothetical protein